MASFLPLQASLYLARLAMSSAKATICSISSTVGRWDQSNVAWSDYLFIQLSSDGLSRNFSSRAVTGSMYPPAAASTSASRGSKTVIHDDWPLSCGRGPSSSVGEDRSHAQHLGARGLWTTSMLTARRDGVLDHHTFWPFSSLPSIWLPRRGLSNPSAPSPSADRESWP